MKSNYTLEELLKAKIGQSTPPPSDAEALWADMNARLDAFPIGNAPGGQAPPPPETILPGQALVPPAPISPAIYLASIFVAGSLILGVFWWKSKPSDKAVGLPTTPYTTEQSVTSAEKTLPGTAPAAASGAELNHVPAPSSTPGHAEATSAATTAASTVAAANAGKNTSGKGNQGTAVLSAGNPSGISAPSSSGTSSGKGKRQKSGKNTSKNDPGENATPAPRLPIAQAGAANTPVSTDTPESGKAPSPQQKVPSGTDTANEDLAANKPALNQNQAPTGSNPPTEANSNPATEIRRILDLPLLPGLTSGPVQPAQSSEQKQPEVKAPVSHLTGIFGENRRAFFIMIGADLEKTPRQRANFVEVGMYANLGLGFQTPVNRRWALRGEGWYQQFATPLLNRVTKTKINTDADRLERLDTLSVTRMAGLSVSLMAVRYLPMHFTLTGGVTMARYNQVLIETGYSQYSVIGNVNGGSGTGFNYSYSAPPSWFQQFQPGLRLGVEKVLFDHWVLGLNMYKSMVNITKFNQGLNWSTNWLLYTGYRF